jgi:hypothetical protein
MESATNIWNTSSAMNFSINGTTYLRNTVQYSTVHVDTGLQAVDKNNSNVKRQDNLFTGRYRIKHLHVQL